jgi:hypothetical protein
LVLAPGRLFLNTTGRFLRAKTRFKDGKEHRYWSIVENRRTSGGRVVQRHVLYLGEINDSQKAAWCRTIQVFDEGEEQPRQMTLFPEDRVAPPLACEVVQIRLSEWQLRRPRQWGACWLATCGSRCGWTISGQTNCRRPGKARAG